MSDPEDSTGQRMREPHVDLDALRLAVERVRYHHRVLWEEEKHYSWYVYVVFGALLFVWSREVCPLWKGLVALGISGLGFVLSLIAYRIICREGELFCKARAYRQQVARDLGIPEWDRPPKWPNKPVVDLLSTDLNESGIRDLFQLSYVFCAAGLAVSFLASSVVVGLHWPWSPWWLLPLAIMAIGAWVALLRRRGIGSRQSPKV